VVGAIVAAIAAVADVRDAIGFSSFAVLVYYAVANAAAWKLHAHQRRWPRGLSVVGLLGCVALASTLPLDSVFGGGALLVAGSLVYWVRRRGSPGADAAER
jgi:basic amino acid/polyamine antiporter, APA family